MTTLDEFVEAVTAYFPEGNLDLLRRAWHFSEKIHKGHFRPCGEDAFSHPRTVAATLVRLKMDVPSIAAALVHDVLERKLATADELERELGIQILQLVEGLTKINTIIYHKAEDRQTESFRKMLLAIARDIRIILLKLADRLHNMQTLDCLPQQTQLVMARETMEVYAPLANRMGISWLKSQLEDLCFKHLYPAEYAELSRQVRAFKTDASDQYVQSVKEQILQKLKLQGIEGNVSGRSKHLYSIYRKLQRQKIELDQLYDLIAFRIIVPSLRECYAALGIIHAEWKPISGRFKDYIAMPKSNMYQSLHTSVIGPYGKRMEVQIRTEEMHRIAEEGIAAHWMYKEGRFSASGKDDGHLGWLRQMVEWQREVDASREVQVDPHVDLFPEEVYVFTPQGHVRELPKNACPIDFAYAIHGDIGHRCVGAKVNGKLVSLKTPLHNGDVVEVLTSPNQTPSKDWLKLVKTSKARNRIRHWVKTQEHEKSVELGREMLEKELRKYKMSLNKMLGEPVMGEAAGDLGFKGVEDLLASVGYGKLSAGQICTRIVPEDKLRAARPKLPGISKVGKVLNKMRRKPSGSAIKIQGIDDVLVRYAKCCNPLPGDEIIGFITRGHGITIHTADCPHLLESDPQRRVEVEWDRNTKTTRTVKIQVLCHDVKGVLAEITTAITQCEANIVGARVHSEGRKAFNEFDLSVENVEQLQQVMAAIRKIKGVYRVERIRDRHAE
ncbi:MAG: bifunctional (p)ppGpp synthetase/guanosine-3',5'-bis(diphosphate) 3'-pyrophosphohydrolase [Desulfuromonadaceae bacterium]|nr:bifunctional (p)ppGpp synthetase/guanosine-3',5'-bis(diphosphate) 3'-pyrophosphohydrolase [Desulfuromonadaceae bacterium]